MTNMTGAATPGRRSIRQTQTLSSMDGQAGAQRAPLPKRKHIRLPREAYANPARTFNITVDALERRRYFNVPSFNDEVAAILRGLASTYRCPIEIYCLMPTHLHLIMRPGTKSVVDFRGIFP